MYCQALKYILGLYILYVHHPLFENLLFVNFGSQTAGKIMSKTLVVFSSSDVCGETPEASLMRPPLGDGSLQFLQIIKSTN